MQRMGQRNKGAKGFLNILLISTLLLTTCYLLPTLAYAADADTVVNNLQKKLADVRDIKGKFTQSSYIKDIEEKQHYSGSFFIKKPSKMMWEYDKPRDEKVIIKDLQTWLYKETENQVIKTNFSKESYSQVPIALLESFENISNDFDVSMTGNNSLKLTPKRRIGFIKTLVVEISDGTFPVRMFTIFDTYGNIIMVDLKEVAVNKGLEDSLFDFTIPEGAEVFDMSAEQAGPPTGQAGTNQ